MRSFVEGGIAQDDLKKLLVFFFKILQALVY
jgi:hypothetical protein